MRYDALIVGAGPAGCAAAGLLAQRGWSVALVEKTEFPRRKVCGEFISAATLNVLEACGVATSFRASAGPPVTRVGIYAGKTMLMSQEEQTWGWALGREHLDMLLRNAAQDAGAVLFQPAEVSALWRGSHGLICILDDRRQIETGSVIAACGSWNPKGPFALPSGPARPSDLFAFKAHLRGGELGKGVMALLAFAGGYGGLVESDRGRMSLSFCIRRDALAKVRTRYGGKAGEAVLTHILHTTKGARHALGAATIEGGFLSTGPIHPGIRRRYHDGIYYTGNIAGEAHPIIAEGISMAIQASGLLAQLLITDRGERYEKEWGHHFGSRIRAASLFAHLAMHRPTQVMSLALLGAVPSLLGAAARLAGKLSVPDSI
jgi:flavin-dependent dehydrogenase